MFVGNGFMILFVYVFVIDHKLSRSRVAPNPVVMGQTRVSERYRALHQWHVVCPMSSLAWPPANKS